MADTKFVWNPRALTAAEQGMADALYDLGISIAADATSRMVPGHLDAPPYGEGLVDSSGVGVWNQGIRIMGPVNKPYSLDLGSTEVVMAVGFGSPLAHLHELGTVKMIARPFLAPAVNRQVKNVKGVVPAIGKRIAEVPE